MHGSDFPTLEAKILESLPLRFDLGHVQPAFLALLYRLCLTSPKQLERLTTTVLDRLLDLTIRQAVEQTSFYSELYSGLLTDQYFGIEELASLPVIDRSDVENAGWAINLRYAEYGFSSYTSGTTTSNPLIINRSKQEQQYIITFFSLLHPPRQPSNSVQLILTLADWGNGHRLQIPGSVHTFPVSLADERGFHQSVRLLKRGFFISGETRQISGIAGSFNDLLPLTAFFASEGHFDVAEQIKLIQTSSQYQTDFSRSWVSNFWHCKIEDRYSLTELFFGARRCLQCGYYHFDYYGIAEAVEVGTNKRITSGRGQLLLTGLYPFTQMTPLIRYSPGDLVDIQQCDCPFSTLGFRLLGRIYGSLRLEPELDAGAFLGVGEVYEVLDPIIDVNRRDFAVSFPHSCDGIGGKPLFSMSRNADGKAKLAIELRYTPVMFPDRINELRYTIKEELSRRCPWMTELLEKDLLLIDFLMPGALGVEPRIDD